MDVNSAGIWLEKYGKAWMQADPKAASELFAENCRYYETPFDDPATGRDGVARYWQAVPEGQSEVQFEYRVLAVFSKTVVAHWNAAFKRTASGTRVKLDGVFLLEFNDAGLCEVLREWWHRQETS